MEITLAFDFGLGTVGLDTNIHCHHTRSLNIHPILIKSKHFVGSTNNYERLKGYSKRTDRLVSDSKC